jgi:protein-L-isoaspartate O-methyltransferase
MGTSTVAARIDALATAAAADAETPPSTAGYAAAAASQLAEMVHTIERHSSLGRTAADRLATLGYELHRSHGGRHPRFAR